jgi:hypothetical protein
LAAKTTPKTFDLANVRNRIVERRMMKPGELQDHPGQPWEHPNAQAAALAGILRQIGQVDSIKAYHSPRAGGQITTIDGHLRRSLDPNLAWPVDILDLTDEEADLMLAVFDPVGALKVVDKAALEALLGAVVADDAAVRDLLEQMARDNGLDRLGGGDGEDPGADIDRAAELQAKWQVQPGNLYGFAPFARCPKCGKRHAIDPLTLPGVVQPTP